MKPLIIMMRVRHHKEMETQAAHNRSPLCTASSQMKILSIPLLDILPTFPPFNRPSSPQRRETLQSPDVLIKRLIFIARQKREFNAHRQLMRFPFWFV